MTITSAKPELRVFPDLEELSRAAADFFCDLANASVRRTGEFFVALSGGSTPRRLYQILGSDADRGRVPWPQTQIFWSDERCVPPDDPQSNYRMVTECLSAVAIPPLNVHRMRGEDPPEQAARAYESELRASFRLLSGDVPRFDLILLGLGEDGHIASLFPGNPVLEDTTHLVAAAYVEKMKMYRLTLTLPVLNNAANAAFLVAGESKRAILSRVLEKPGSMSGQSAPARLPAQRVRPADGRLLWFVDEAAAGGLPRQQIGDTG